MRLNFEKFLNDNGLKIGDKVKFSDGDICEISKVNRNHIILVNLVDKGVDFKIELLGACDFEKVESKKKVGDLLCENNTDCFKCPLRCINCGITCGGIHANDTLREVFEATLVAFPELELMREYLEKELDKEVEE